LYENPKAQAQVTVADDPNSEDTPKANEVEALIRKIQELEGEKEALRRELWKSRGKPSEILGLLFIPYGAIALILSVVLNSPIPAYIGLGLTLWGALLLFIRPTRYVKSKLLTSMTLPPLTIIHEVMKALNYKGKGVYLPPQYLKEHKGGTLFISSEKGIIIPPLGEVAEGRVSVNPRGIFLTPPGLSLANLYEDELGKHFAEVDLLYLQNNLPKLFIEGLKIAEDLEMDMESKMIHAKITGTICGELCKEARKIPNICSLGCPLCSSIAITLTRATGKPVVIENNQLSADGKVIEAYYRTLGTVSSMDFPTEEQTVAASTEAPPTEVSPPPPKTAASAEFSAEVVPSAPVKPARGHLGRLLTNFVGFVLFALGLYTVAWVGWLTWYDITTWGKSLALIFFGSRTGEVISLGVGMKVIHYLLIGLALLFSGTFTFLRKRLHKV